MQFGVGNQTDIRSLTDTGKETIILSLRTITSGKTLLLLPNFLFDKSVILLIVLDTCLLGHITLQTALQSQGGVRRGVMRNYSAAL